MPNHCTSRVSLTGPPSQLIRFKSEFIVEREKTPYRDSGQHLDFNRVIAMPEQLADTESNSTADIGYAAWYGPEHRTSILAPQGWREILDYLWVKEANIQTREELQSFLARENPEYKEQGDRKKRNLDRYGYASWYDWANARWGTKWNSYAFRWVNQDHQRGPIQFTMDTAWSPPVPVFAELSKLLPGVKISVKSFDEGWGFACQGYFLDGQDAFDTVEATKEMYREVYGSEPDREDEEE